MSNLFELKIMRQHWIKDDGTYDNEDLCSHGLIYLKIGDEILSDTETGSWTTTAAGLHLLRTLYSDYHSGDYAGQLIPCCGHFMIPSNDNTRADIFGCPNGIDWSVYHKENMVEIITDKGANITIAFDDYRKSIIDFVSDVELFFGNPKDKVIPDDDLTKNAFNLFWTEWHALKKQDIINSI